MRLFLRTIALLILSATPILGQGKGEPVGRYQTVSVPPGYLALIDTTTGECWAGEDRKWIDLKFPTKDTRVTDGKPGRFQLSPLSGKEGQTFAIVVCDTADGRCWQADFDPRLMKWHPLPDPRRP